MKIDKSTIIFAVLCIIGAGFALNAVNNMLSIPDVKVSYSTNECIGVTNYAEGDAYTCSDLPPKYNHIWVK